MLAGTTRASLRVVLAALVVAAAAALGTSCHRPEPLPDLGTIPPFALTGSTGASFGSAELAGTVWVADFIFTRCPDFCPALTTRMGDLQRTIPAAAGTRLVSFSVDPDHDTPEVLAAYAARAGAGPYWAFVTGPHDALAALLQTGFHVAYASDGPPTSPITHSDRFVLVDRALRIRGYYHGTDAADVRRLVQDAQRLRDDPAA